MLAEAMQKVGKDGVITSRKARLETYVDGSRACSSTRATVALFVTEPRDEGDVQGLLYPPPREEISAVKDLIRSWKRSPRRASPCSSSARTSKAMHSRRWSSTSCAGR